jgi:subfamily B ATP-binding cassette protein MsbA
LSTVPAVVKPAAHGWDIYRRLIKYAKPHAGMFSIGVLGAILFAVSNASLAYLVKQFMKGTFVLRDPDIIWQVPIGVVVLFTLRGVGDYIAN